MALVALTLGMLGGAARATPVLLVDAESGKVLEQQEAGKTWYPASVTKLMTVYVALNAIKEGRLTPDTLLTVSPLAASQSPTKMGFGVGTKVTLDNALKMLMVKSANDMAVVIAEGVGGSHADFIQEMNATAARLGMTGTHYENPNGLPDLGQITTARDLAVLARHLIYDFPEHEMLFRIPAIRLGKIVLRNYNRLIDRYPGADGMKTGFICASGFNLVATASRNGKRLIAVILGAPSAVARTEQAALLFEKGFQPSWSIFGASSPTLEAIANSGGPATDMNVCNRKRAVAAAENEDENLYNQGEGAASYAVSAAVAAGFSKGEGAALLQNLPPSMPPIRVFVGPAGAAPAQQDDALQAAKPAPPATAAKTDGDKKSKQKTAVITPNAADAPKDGSKAAAKPDAKADAKPAASKPAAKPATAKPTSGDKAANAAPAAKPKPKAPDADDGGEPLTFGPPPTTRPGT
ncbi:D-alanyl-D-alanine carboxypeptidase family protein [Aquabacter sp. CN5-332]|uniref:D-alanyl-D-alanine carboxypeptidase family protein n=1 Tax=Aquabacter sp. CN5-332 TaxID=3156608 RepID=UPI0032B509BB